MINVLLKVYFDVFGQRTEFVLCLVSFCRYMRRVTKLVNYFVIVFISIIGEIPDKRIPEGLFLSFLTKNKSSLNMFLEFL